MAITTSNYKTEIPRLAASGLIDKEFEASVKEIDELMPHYGEVSEIKEIIDEVIGLLNENKELNEEDKGIKDNGEKKAAREEQEMRAKALMLKAKAASAKLKLLKL